MDNETLRKKVLTTAKEINDTLPDVLPITRAKMATHAAIRKSVLSLTVEDLLKGMPDREIQSIMSDIFHVYGKDTFNAVCDINFENTDGIKEIE